MIASCLEISPPLGTRTRYGYRPFSVSYPSVTDQLVKKKIDIRKKKFKWLNNSEWNHYDQAQLFTKSEEELFLLYGHPIEEYVECKREAGLSKVDW